MRNLQLQLCERVSLFGDSNGVTKFVLNPENPREIFVCCGLQIKKVDVKTSELVDIVNLADEVPTISENDVVNMVYYSFINNLCVALKTGQIVLVNIESIQVNTTEIDELCDSEVRALALSPDQEILVIVADNRVFLINSFLDIVNRAPLYDESFGECEFITVGWGKKETQFHGSEGKAAAKAKVQCDNGLEIKDSDSVVVTWRGDGNYFAVGFTHNAQTLFKVFNREGVLQYTSEKQPGIECNFSWRPSGNLIATTQKYPNKYVVAFFEKNGLKHGEFVLDLKYEDVSIKRLSWSNDSEVLSVWYTDHKTRKDNLLLYTVNNYCWYLKQSIDFKSDSKITSIQWEDDLSHNASGKRLHVLLDTGEYTLFEWIWNVHQSIGKTSSDDSTVAVINGKNLLVTSFRHAVVPPPMASTTLEFQSNINHIVFCSHSDEKHSVNSNSFLTLSQDFKLCLYAKNVKKYDLLGSVILHADENAIISQMLWLSHSGLLCIINIDRQTVLWQFEIEYEPKLSIDVVNKHDLPENVIGLRALSRNEALLQFKSGKLILFSLVDGMRDFRVSFPESCHLFEIINLPPTQFVCGLTHRNRFYLDDVMIANNCNSFYIHSDFLMLTTLQHQLLTLPLASENVESLLKSDSHDVGKEPSAFFVDRRIERGARLVTAVSCDSRTVLQMPRGNIEAIQPRDLSLRIIGGHLDKHEYHTAFDSMRKQRINLNLIHDHDPSGFFAHVTEFIEQINNASWLCLFIAELDERDVTKSIYSGSYRGKTKTEPKENDKVQRICNAMREKLENDNDGNKNFLPILSTYVKNSDRKSLEAALLRIKKLKHEESTLSNVTVSANDALKYLLYLVNVDALYDVALGLYDFDLVMFVANKSQKDPKEYIPYLNNLNGLEEYYKKFTIDKDLKRYESALANLIKCPDDRGEELISFIKQHKLYTSALRQIDDTDPRYIKVADEYGNFLKMHKHYLEAGLMYKRSSNKIKAIECFTEALEWQSAIFLANELSFSDTEINKLKRTLFTKLKEIGSYEEALMLLSDDDIEEKVTCSLEGKLFKRSFVICQERGRSDLIDKLVKPAVVEQYEMVLGLIEQNRDQFINQKNRLIIVRQNKIEKAKHNEEEPPIDCDLYSDTSSIMGSTLSKSSGRSYRSSKNRRKHERKMVSLKEGSRYEDIALMRALYVLITSTNNLKNDVSNLNFILQWIGKDNEASKLQKSLDLTLVEMKTSTNEIWPAEPKNIENKSNPFKIEDATIDASVSLEPHMRIPPMITESKWKFQTL